MNINQEISNRLYNALGMLNNVEVKGKVNFQNMVKICHLIEEAYFLLQQEAENVEINNQIENNEEGK